MAVQIKFTLNAWAKAIAVQERTLAIRLTKAGFKNNGLISAKEIIDAMCGEKDASIIRLNDAKAKQLEQKEKIRDEVLVELPVAERELWGNLLGPLKQEMDAMPDKLAPLVNPESPASAKKLLFEWTENTKKKLIKNK